MNGFNETVKGITTTVGNAAVIENNASTASVSTLTVNTAGSDFTYDGIVRNRSTGTSIFALTKAGAGTLTLANTAAVVPNSYTGDTTITDGKLVLENLSGFGATPIAINSTVADALTINQTTRDLTTAATLSGAGEFTKTGAGKLTLSGASIFAGVTNVDDGALIVTGTLTGSTVNVNTATATVRFAASQTLAALNIADGASVILSDVPPPAFDEGFGALGGEIASASVGAVPEPGSVALLFGGLATLLSLRRRRA